MAEPDLIDDSEPEVPSNPGEILTQERKSLRLSQQDVADQLNLRVDVIDAIESGDFESIPGGETFVRGYIRAYAHLVDIDEEDVLEERNYVLTPDVDFKPAIGRVVDKKSPRRKRRRIRSSHSRFGLVLVFLAVVIIATWSFSDIPKFNIGQWFGSLTESNQETVAEISHRQTGDLPVQVNVTRLDTSEFNKQQSNQNREDAPAVISQMDTDTQPVASVIVDNSVSNTDPDSMATEKTLVIGTDPLSEVAEALPPTEAMTPESTGDTISLTQDGAVITQTADTARSTDDVVVSTQNSLMLVSEDASWAEVRDATGQRLLYAMLQPRQARNLSGQAPFDITLGNASTVKIRLDDSALDISDHIRPGRTAHLRVDTDGVSKTR